MNYNKIFKLARDYVYRNEPTAENIQKMLVEYIDTGRAPTGLTKLTVINIVTDSMHLKTKDRRANELLTISIAVESNNPNTSFKITKWAQEILQGAFEPRTIKVIMSQRM
ncbi:MAG: hypothetical protein Q8P20_00245 [bacterium]|nr:hypothetical protein [bacterium]